MRAFSFIKCSSSNQYSTEKAQNKQNEILTQIYICITNIIFQEGKSFCGQFLLGNFIFHFLDYSFLHYKQQQNWTEQWYYKCYIRGTLWVHIHKSSNFITAYVHFFGQGSVQWSETVMGFFCEQKRLDWYKGN